MIRTSLALSLALLAQAPQQGGGEEPERYPQVAEQRVLRYFNLKGKLDRGRLNEALKDAGYELAYGPMEAASRPSNSVVAVSVPFEAKVRDVERALKKGKVKTEELELFLFRGRIENGFPTFGIDLKKLDYMVGISNEIRWCDMGEQLTQFYCVAGELEAAELEELYCKLQRPLGDEPATLGEVVRDRLTWTLAREPEERERKDLEQEILELDGVTGVELDGAELRLELELAGLRASGLSRASANGPGERGAPPWAAFASRELWELLEAEGLVSAGG
jgi:hypothetical protein